MEEWTGTGFPKNKLVLGLSTYGHTGVLSSAWRHSPGDTWTRHMGTAGPLTRLVGYLSYYEVSRGYFYVSCPSVRHGLPVHVLAVVDRSRFACFRPKPAAASWRQSAVGTVPNSDISFC